MLEITFFLLLGGILFLELFYPFKILKVEKCPKRVRGGKKDRQKVFVVHVHTCYSYDSLGKPQEVEKIAQELSVEKVFITDHDRRDLDLYLKGFKRLVPGYEYQDPEYGRLLKLQMGRYTVVAHPNNTKKKLYRWKGKFEKDFLYELVDLKDVLYAAPFWLKGYFAVRFLLLYPLLDLKALNFFPKLVPLQNWINLYLERTKGYLKVIGGLDLHVKLSLWEKPKKFFSFPSYRWGFYLLQNLSYKGDLEKSLKEGTFYLSFCLERFAFEKGYIQPKGRFLFFNHFGDKSVKVNDCGKVEEGARLVSVYSYTFKVGGLYFGLKPVAVFNV